MKNSKCIFSLVEIDDQAESDYLTQTAYSIRYSGFLNNYWASYWIGKKIVPSIKLFPNMANNI